VIASVVDKRTIGMLCLVASKSCKFLGMGEKDVAVPFNGVQVTNKNNNKWYLVMNASKDTLKNAKGFKYDRNAMTWVPEEQPATTGTQKPSNR